MSTNIIVQKRICLEPEFLNSKLKQNIFDKLKKSTMNECSKEFGYILNIVRLVKIIDNYVSNASSEIVFEVMFEIETLKPEIGKVFTGDVCMVFVGGIFLNIKNKIKVLIPITTMKEYKFDQALKIFKKDKTVIKQGDILNVKITGIKYSKKNYSCFGKFD
jgi:DNA-directed RNA polymerase subunit E'/Rpb7